MLKVITLIICMFFSTYIYAQNVTIYIVDKDDYDLSNVVVQSVSTSELNMDYKSVVMLYDNSLQKCIGAKGNTTQSFLSSQELAECVTSIMHETLNPFNGILGLYWGMDISGSIQQLNKLGIRVQISDVQKGELKNTNSLSILNVSWNSERYESGMIFFENNKLTEIVLGKFHMTAADATLHFEHLKNKFQSYSTVSEIIPTLSGNQYIVTDGNIGRVIVTKEYDETIGIYLVLIDYLSDI